MEESNKLYKDFEGKKVRIITSSKFTYNTNNLQVFNDCVKFVDNRGNTTILKFSEIKFIQEINF